MYFCAILHFEENCSGLRVFLEWFGPDIKGSWHTDTDDDKNDNNILTNQFQHNFRVVVIAFSVCQSTYA
jgi:hypothetical protein